jgi:hypothetical protein
MKYTGISEIKSSYIFVIISSTSLSFLFYVVLRLADFSRLEAVLVCALLLSSSAFIFWSGIIELYVSGACTILLAMSVTLVWRHRFKYIFAIVTSAASLSVTVTNWVAGLAASFFSFGLRRAVQISVLAFVSVAVLTPVQYLIFPRAGGFLKINEEKSYIALKSEGHVIDAFVGFWTHAVVAPQVFKVPHEQEHRNKLSFQGSSIKSSSWLGKAATVIWVSLLACGLWGMFRRGSQVAFRATLGVTLLGQLGLHLFYGPETFLYAAHFAPLLILLAAYSLRTPVRRAALISLPALVILAGLNNFEQFAQARDLLNEETPTERDRVLRQMALRASDPWPRGEGHIVLGRPGARAEDKAYVEPGGSFSPAFNSFGISFWAMREGKIVRTSDSVPLEHTYQSYQYPTLSRPGLEASTPDFVAQWTSDRPGAWQLRLVPHVDEGETLAIVLRSVGPAGGAIKHIARGDGQLLINGRWRVRAGASLRPVSLGDESDVGWITDSNDRDNVASPDGWGYARFEVSGRRVAELHVEDLGQLPRTAPLALIADIGASVTSPDPDFSGSFSAQQITLLTGLVAAETRPGDPIHYPLQWQRDGAYVLVALVRTGHLAIAKQLVTVFAESDFFGGFGAEADAPGLSLWCIEELARAARESELNAALWPHVKRKAEIILRMMMTGTEMVSPFSGPVVPKYKNNPNVSLLAKPPEAGLISGRMDWHFPLLYVNAVSYRGLLDAATFAARQGRNDLAHQWRAAAGTIRDAWLKALHSSDDRSDELANARSYIIGLWPTGIAAGSERYAELMERRWASMRASYSGGFAARPLWTYFELAEAHQWLLLNRSDRVWATLRFFWSQQPAPGTYGLWEGRGEENTFNRWEAARGWVRPSSVTPHYWSAAEMLLLQADMLVRLEEDGQPPVLVIGAGIPADWLKMPLAVDRILTRAGRVSWRWDGAKVRVETADLNIPVLLGPAFPDGTVVTKELINAAALVRGASGLP